MYTVLGNPRNRTMRVLWMLEELGQDYEIRLAAPHSPEITRGNPGGKAPVLHDGDDVISDSVAIVTYLADKHGAFTHTAGTPARGHQDAMTQFCVDEIEGALWTAAKNSFVHPEELRVTEIKRVAVHEFARALETLSKHIDGRDFIAGDGFTVPDLLLGHCAGWAANAKFEIPDGAAADYLARMRARPALARALARGAAATEAAA